MSSRLGCSPIPGRFFLVLDGLKLTFELRVGSAGKIVLNTLDIGSVKAIVRRRELLFQLSERASELVTKSDLKKFDEDHTESDNPAVKKAAVELGKELDDIEHEIDNLQIFKNGPNYRHTEYNSWNSEFKDWVKNKGFARFTAFVDDVEDRRPLSDDARKLLDDPSTSGIQRKTLDLINSAIAKGDPPDFKPAAKEVTTRVIDGLILPRFNKEKMAELDGRLKVLNAKLEPLRKKLKGLETR